ncbi:hypothetical protein SK128_028288 [Halocaridina rubra]|uniref:Uncharacterized protein n=1 Tax=Halocaridina rubra TaxID=373956 RepID=A0AAN8X010_HALRR
MYKNYESTSAGMEAEAAVKLFGRSEELKCHYVSFVGDGEFSAYIAETAMNNGNEPFQDHQTHLCGIHSCAESQFWISECIHPHCNEHWLKRSSVNFGSSGNRPQKTRNEQNEETAQEGRYNRICCRRILKKTRQQRGASVTLTPSRKR